jgi:alkylation response protein AidB-like acyl-CoA dehydrogenase
MNFELTEDQQAIQAAIEKLCEQYDDEYWLVRDREGGFPHDFHRTLAEAGWLGIAMSAEYGGSGLGMTDAHDQRFGCGSVGRVGGTYEHLRPEPGAGVRQ